MTRLTTVGLRDDTQPASALQIIQWAVATGTVSVIAAAYETPVLSLEDGLCLCFRALGANTSATPTFSPDGLTAHTITKLGGVALAPGDIAAANAEVILRYNIANTRWELLNPKAVTAWVAAGGTADALTVTYSPAVPAVYDGLVLAFRATAANATTTPTFAPNGLTARTVTRLGGSAVMAGNIKANGEYLVRYNLANTRWELLNPASLTTWVAAGGTADAITATYSPDIGTLTDGMTLSFRAAADNLTTAPTFSPDSLAAHAITKFGGATLTPGDIKANGEYTVRYNLANTRWEITATNSQSDELIQVLTANDTAGGNVNTAQAWFVTLGGVTVKAATTYEMEGHLYLSRAAGTTSHTTSILFAGTATITSIDYFCEAMTGDANTLVAINGVWATAATAVVVKAASTSATEQLILRVRGYVRINAAGTFIPQFIYSVAPGGTPTIQRNSFFRLRPIGSNTFATKGTWA